MPRPSRNIPFVFACLVGCASSQPVDDEPPAIEPEPAQTARPTEADPIFEDGSPLDASAEIPAIEESAEVIPAPEPLPEPTVETVQRRDDGRPAWWFPEVRRGPGEQLVLCAEALGRTLVDTRRGAVAAARARIDDLRADAGLDPLDEQDPHVHVERALVWPLPGSSEDPESYRYAGYVWVRFEPE